jgi:hypothetical protein
MRLHRSGRKGNNCRATRSDGCYGHGAEAAFQQTNDPDSDDDADKFDIPIYAFDLNGLFEGKAGEVFEILMQACDVHTVLRLPRGTFTPYSQGVKANAIFFSKGRSTEQVWIFDARSNIPTLLLLPSLASASGMFPFTSLYTLPSTALKTLSDFQLGHGIEGIPDPHYRTHAFTFSNARYRGLHLKLMHMHYLSLQAVRSRSFLLISPAKRDRKKSYSHPSKRRSMSRS